MPVEEVLPRSRRQCQTMTAISDTALHLFSERGADETTVAEVAEAAGVSVRTFHRYFVSKEDAVSPVLDAGWRRYVELFAARPTSEPVRDGLLAALAGGLEATFAGHHRVFLRGLPASPVLHPVWLSVQERTQAALLPVLARRLGLRSAGAQARFVTACVVSANRLAVEAWARNPKVSVVASAARSLDLIDGALLRPKAARAATTTAATTTTTTTRRTS